MKKKIDSYKAFEAKKPGRKVIKEERLDYNDMMRFLEKKYKFNSRGFTGIPSAFDRDNHFDNWCDKHHLPKIDSDGKHRSSSQIFWTQYKNAEDGEKTNAPYMDFWHYLCDYNEENVRNGGYIYIPKEADTSKDHSPEKSIETFRKSLNHFKNDKKTTKILQELIAREEEAIKNPKKDPYKNWKQDITDLIFKEFGEFEEDGYLKVWVEW